MRNILIMLMTKAAAQTGVICPILVCDPVEAATQLNKNQCYFKKHGIPEDVTIYMRECYDQSRSKKS